MMSFYLLFSSLKKDLHRDSHFFFLVAVLGKRGPVFLTLGDTKSLKHNR